VNKSFKKILLSAILAATSVNAFASGPDLSGYFDVAMISPKGKSTYFHQQHLNLLMQHQVDKFKFFSELEFEDTPNIDYGRVPGPAGGGVDAGKGRLFLERAYGEMAITRHDSIRMGQILTPTYYYLNHYPSIIVNYTNPLTLKTLFTYNEMGVQFFGEKGGIRYDIWTGKGPADSDKAQNESGTNYGGKLSYTTHTKKYDLTVAAMAESYAMGDHPAAPSASVGTANANAKKANMAMAAEVVLNYEDFTLWSEYGTRDMKDAKGHDNLITGSNKMTAYYAIASYSIPVGKKAAELLPWIMIDGLKYKDGFEGAVESKQIRRTTLGLTYRPVPTVTWKLEHTLGGSYKPVNADGSLFHIADANYAEDKTTIQFVYFYN
jgi:hypothetical protein